MYIHIYICIYISSLLQYPMNTNKVLTPLFFHINKAHPRPNLTTLLDASEGSHCTMECENQMPGTRVGAALRFAWINEHDSIAVCQRGRNSPCQAFPVEPGPVAASVLDHPPSPPKPSLPPDAAVTCTNPTPVHPALIHIKVLCHMGARPCVPADDKGAPKAGQITTQRHPRAVAKLQFRPCSPLLHLHPPPFSPSPPFSHYSIPRASAARWQGW